MPNPKYAVHPGPVMSGYDGKIHFISYIRLVRLYKVHISQCFEWTKYSIVTCKWEDYIHLFPSYSGRYTLPKG